MHSKREQRFFVGLFLPIFLVLQWHITERCNRRCAYCYRVSPSTEELAFPELLKILERFRELLDRMNPARRS